MATKAQIASKAATKAKNAAAQKTAAAKRKAASTTKKLAKATARKTTVAANKASRAAASALAKANAALLPAKKPAKVQKVAPVLAGLPLVLSMIAALPPISDPVRAAFTGLADDASCDALGVRTKSQGVFTDALAWLAQMRTALAITPTIIPGYTTPRFVWMLECVRALGQAIEAQATAQSGVGAVRETAQSTRTSALSARTSLSGKLGTLAGRNAASKVALKTARGNAKTDGELVLSVQNLVAIATTWLASATPNSAALILVESVNLAQADVDTANAAVTALIAATGAATGAKIIPSDTPAVNRVEGRVLFEMETAMAAFNRAHKSNAQVPKLSPGKATAHLLGVRSAPVAVVAPAAPAAAAPAAAAPAAAAPGGAPAV